jgi:hypothetical protein
MRAFNNFKIDSAVSPLTQRCLMTPLSLTQRCQWHRWDMALTQRCHRRFETRISSRFGYFFRNYFRMWIKGLGEMFDEKTRVQKSRETVPLSLCSLQSISSVKEAICRSQWDEMVLLAAVSGRQMSEYRDVREPWCYSPDLCEHGDELPQQTRLRRYVARPKWDPLYYPWNYILQTHCNVHYMLYVPIHSGWSKPTDQCFGSASVLCGSGSGSYLKTKCGSGSRIQIRALTKQNRYL